MELSQNNLIYVRNFKVLKLKAKHLEIFAQLVGPEADILKYTNFKNSN